MDETVPSLATIVENLARAQSELLRAAEAVPKDQWKTRPAEGRWSAGEMIGHLNAVERTILSRADKLLQKPPKSPPFFKRLHISMIMVEAREIRLTKQDARDCRDPTENSNKFALVELFYHSAGLCFPFVLPTGVGEKCGKRPGLLGFREKVLEG